MHRFILHNDDIVEASQGVLSPGQVGLLSGWGVFSTLRVAGGVLFAWERHWARMRRDAEALHIPLPDDGDSVRARLLRLVAANSAADATLRVVVVRNRGGLWEGPNNRGFDLIALTADLHDWGSGVRLALQPQGRHAGSPFAGTKTLSWAHNLTFLENAQRRGFDEVLLLNERGEVSECTSANIFAVKGATVWTPPLTAGCLPGVTRELLVGEVRAEGIAVVEKTLYPRDLEEADEVFITSTTRDLLPVAAIEGLRIRQAHDVRCALQGAFGKYVAEYVARRRPSPAAD